MMELFKLRKNAKLPGQTVFVDVVKERQIDCSQPESPK